MEFSIVDLRLSIFDDRDTIRVTIHSPLALIIVINVYVMHYCVAVRTHDQDVTISLDNDMTRIIGQDQNRVRHACDRVYNDRV